MNRAFRTTLYCLLAFALLTSGLPAWSMNNLAANETPAVLVDADAASGHEANCHTDGSPATDTKALGQDCCESDETCDHGDCRCLCPVFSLVVPVRATATTWASPASPAWELTAPFPNTITSRLLRPPRA